MSSLGLDGKFVVVTGAAQGIGAATARKFAENGSHVFLVDLNEDGLKTTTQQLQNDFPDLQFHYAVCDVSNVESVEKLGETYSTFFASAPNVVVNNAAICQIIPFLEVSPEQFQKTLAVNVTGTHLVSQIFVKKAIAQNLPQSIVNVSSITTHAGPEYLGGYVASKSGIIGLTKSMAKELGPHKIRVNAVLPGFTETAMVGHIKKGAKDDVAMNTPLRRLGKPEDIANVILFLGSDLAGFCTASFVDVNGGLTF